MTAARINVSLDQRQVNEPRQFTDKLFPVPVSHDFCHWHTPLGEILMVELIVSTDDCYLVKVNIFFARHAYQCSPSI